MAAVAISYVSTLLLELVDEQKVGLDDKVSQWLPQIPHSDEVTLRQLAQMTSGIVDYVTAPELTEELYADPFRSLTPEQLIAIGTSRPLLYQPGTNWNYAHTNYVILGLALEKITGKRMTDVLQEKVLGPLGLTNTTDPGTPDIPGPALHAYTSERRYALGIPATTPFYEDSTYWNPSWTITRGAIQTTNIYDLSTTATAIGTGKLLSPGSYQKMITKDLIREDDHGARLPHLLPAAGRLHLRAGPHLLRRLAGAKPAVRWRSRSVRLPARAQGCHRGSRHLLAGSIHQPEFAENSADYLWRRIAAVLTPADAPPIPPDQQ